MKWCALALFATCVWAQSQKNQATYTYDINGNRTRSSNTSTTKTNGQTVTTTNAPSINGGAVTTNGSSERVISDGPGGKVIERIVKKFDRTGRPAGSEKVRIEESKNPDGSLTTRTTVWDSDINGSYMPRQRSVARTAVNGNVVRTDTEVETANPNGGFDLNEKRVTVAQTSDQTSQKDVTIFRKDANGRFLESSREITQSQKQNGQDVTTTTEYNAPPGGKMALAGQKVATQMKQPDGTEVTITDVYGNASTGQYGASKVQPQLREQQILETKVGPGGAVIETFRVRRPAIDSKRLGPPETVSQTVCTGNCLPPPAAPAQPAPAQQAQAPAPAAPAAQPAGPPQP
ncbi:MAG: hypothetical protein R2762_03640 [Bryobacteraceae bacterium]